MSAELNFEEISFQIIAYAGEAKSKAVLAIREAKNGNFTEAHNLIEKAESGIVTAEQAHMQVISEEANGTKITIPVLFMHAEDQLLTTQTLLIVAEEFIDVYKEIKGKGTENDKV